MHVKMVEDLEVVKFIREQVQDWDDDIISTARFKAFSGQRPDWEPRFQFWRDLIIKIAQRFNLLFLSRSQMKNCWFNKGGLSPLCLDDVLLEMYKTGQILRMTDLGDPKRGQLSQLLKKLMFFPSAFRSTNLSDVLNDRLILSPMLEDKAASIINALSETHWTSSYIITMKRFESEFKEHSEAHAVLSYLSRQGKARYLSVKSKELIEGVKVSLSSAPCSSTPSVDSVVLQLVWTLEELQLQLSVIEEQDKRLRTSALAALKSGDKKLALRKARQLKLASESREKVASFCNRVEEVLRAIADTESAKKVSEAIQLGAQAIKENKTEVEDVHSCLQELDEFMDSQQQIHNALESTSYAAVEDEDIEDELNKLESQIRDEKDENLVVSTSKPEDAKASTSPDSLCAAMEDLTLKSTTEDRCSQNSGAVRDRTSRKLEAA